MCSSDLYFDDRGRRDCDLLPINQPVLQIVDRLSVQQHDNIFGLTPSVKPAGNRLGRISETMEIQEGHSLDESK